MATPSLIFEMQLPRFRSWELITGSLILKETAAAAGIKFLATSGCCAYQYDKSFLIPGRGCLPPSEVLAPKTWEVETRAIELQQVKGVEGNFYAIKPFAVSFMGVRRSDLGVHQDANAPGSAGCIVIRDRDHWKLFQEKMKSLSLKGLQRLPLTVKYTIA